MLHLVFGFTSPNRDEIPVLLYQGSDGDEVERLVRESLYPRIEVAYRLLLNPRKRWSEDHAAAYLAAASAGHIAKSAPAAAAAASGELETLRAELSAAQAELAEVRADLKLVTDPHRRELEALADEKLIEVARTFEVEVGTPLDRKALIKSILTQAS